ncbi:type III secretion system cytoplasmic ring protein SctQ [Pandoraea sputorum]|uniref:type III secretion system cytoplasmic ring protein SctQ n=1 Tax=Pandoraea sputorum TaxID=93222 RepID=UPI002AF6C15E|nr:type III secretion system cytoplasmic ring protein SctQ [Pandoraea sputorum]
MTPSGAGQTVMPKYRPLALPSLSQAQVQALDLMHRLASPVASIGGRQWRASILPLRGIPERGLACIRMTGHIGGHRFSLSVGERILYAVMRTHVPELSDAPLEDDLLRPLVSHALAHWLAAFGCDTPLHLDSVVRAPLSSSFAPGTALGLTFRTLKSDDSSTPTEQIIVVTELSGESLCALARWSEERLPKRDHFVPNAELRRTATIRLTLEVGRTATSPRVWRGIGPGDVIFFLPHGTASGLHVHFCAEHRPLVKAVMDQHAGMTIIGNAMQVSDEQFPLDSASSNANQDVTAPETEPQENGENVSLSDIPLHLTFDIGGCELTLEEVENLTPGTIINLNRALPEVVSIRANGVLIGRGEMVDIDGSVGVMLTQTRFEAS